ncbi:MAG: CAP domain-containing protein [Xanthobacteraceae bacterium]
MNRASAAALTGLLIGVAALIGCASNYHPPSDLAGLNQNLATADAKVDVEVARAMISGYRKANGLGPVAVDPELMKMASEQARAMATHDKLDHSVWLPFQQRIQRSSFDAAVAVENIAAGYDTLAEAFSGWRASPPHRSNMLNPAVTKMGIAAAYAPHSKYKVFWSLILARPDAPPS